MLITTAQINANAFLTPLDDSFFKSNIMYSVQEKDLRSIMGDALLDAVIADTASFPILHETYIIPFLAYQIKYYTLRLISSETKRYFKISYTLLMEYYQTQSMVLQYLNQLSFLTKILTPCRNQT